MQQKEEDIHANYFVHSCMDFFVVLWFQTPMKNLDCFCKWFYYHTWYFIGIYSYSLSVLLVFEIVDLYKMWMLNNKLSWKCIVIRITKKNIGDIDGVALCTIQLAKKKLAEDWLCNCLHFHINFPCNKWWLVLLFTSLGDELSCRTLGNQSQTRLFSF